MIKTAPVFLYLGNTSGFKGKECKMYFALCNWKKNEIHRRKSVKNAPFTKKLKSNVQALEPGS